MVLLIMRGLEEFSSWHMLIGVDLAWHGSSPVACLTSLARQPLLVTLV
jgi:hypothetical protein